MSPKFLALNILLLLLECDLRIFQVEYFSSSRYSLIETSQKHIPFTFRCAILNPLKNGHKFALRDTWVFHSNKLEFFLWSTISISTLLAHWKILTGVFSELQNNLKSYWKLWNHFWHTELQIFDSILSVANY